MVQKGDGGRELCIWCSFNAISQEVCLFSTNLWRRPSGSQQVQFVLKTGMGKHGKFLCTSVFNQHLGHFFSPYIFSLASEFSALSCINPSFPSGEKPMEYLENLEQSFRSLHCVRNWPFKYQEKVFIILQWRETHTKEVRLPTDLWFPKLSATVSLVKGNGLQLVQTDHAPLSTAQAACLKNKQPEKQMESTDSSP